MRFSSVHFNSRWHLRALVSPYALHEVSVRKFPKHCLRDSFTVGLTDDGPFSSFGDWTHVCQCYVCTQRRANTEATCAFLQTDQHLKVSHIVDAKFTQLSSAVTTSVDIQNALCRAIHTVTHSESHIIHGSKTAVGLIGSREQRYSCLCGASVAQR